MRVYDTSAMWADGYISFVRRGINIYSGHIMRCLKGLRVQKLWAFDVRCDVSFSYIVAETLFRDMMDLQVVGYGVLQHFSIASTTHLFCTSTRSQS